MIHFKFVGIKDMHNIYYLGLCNDNIHESLDEFEIRLDLNTGFHGNR